MIYMEEIKRLDKEQEEILKRKQAIKDKVKEEEEEQKRLEQIEQQKRLDEFLKQQNEELKRKQEESKKREEEHNEKLRREREEMDKILKENAKNSKEIKQSIELFKLRRDKLISESKELLKMSNVDEYQVKAVYEDRLYMNRDNLKYRLNHSLYGIVQHLDTDDRKKINKSVGFEVLHIH